MTRMKITEPLQRLKSDHDYHVYQVYRDPEFLEDITILEKLEAKPSPDHKQISELKRAIAQEYAITVGDVNWFVMGTILAVAQRTDSARYEFNPDNGKYTIEFDIDAPKAEIDEAYAAFDRWRKFIRKGATKRKTPFYPEIVYAIFKLRREKLTFAAIYNQFCDPKSPQHIKAVSSIFDTPDDLRRHYNKHKPE